MVLLLFKLLSKVSRVVSIISLIVIISFSSTLVSVCRICDKLAITCSVMPPFCYVVSKLKVTVITKLLSISYFLFI